MMIIGYGQPQLRVSIDGANMVGASALVDGRPSSLARVTDVTESARLRIDWDGSAPIRIVAVLGLTCPAGTLLVLTGRLEGQAGYAHDLGGSSCTQAVTELPDGSRAAWWVLPTAVTGLAGLQLEVMSAGAGFDVGEFVAMPAVEIPHEPGSSAERIDPSLVERTLGGGLNVVARRTYRRIRATPTADYVSAVKGGALAGGMDWARLTHRLAGSARVAMALHWRTPSELHQDALYGRAVSGAATHRAGILYGSGEWVFEEVPPQ